MITNSTILYLYVETPLHAGAGSGLSSIDLPIQRERTTQYPMIQGSGIKGKLRAAARSAPWDNADIAVVFGPESNSSEHAGALIAGDARILLFPVRSLNGVFAYTTSFDVLNRFLRDTSRSQVALPWSITEELRAQIQEDQETPVEGQEDKRARALVSDRKHLAADGRLVLEEFDFNAIESKGVKAIANWLATSAIPGGDEYRYWRDKVQSSLVILPENDFRDFVVNATEVITRIRIDPGTKTVKNGALWTEEHLPTDTLLYVPIYATNARKLVTRGENQTMVPALSGSEILEKARSLEQSQHGYLQLGGDETVGRGMVRMHWQKEESN